MYQSFSFFNVSSKLKTFVLITLISTQFSSANDILPVKVSLPISAYFAFEFKDLFLLFIAFIYFLFLYGKRNENY